MTQWQQRKRPRPWPGRRERKWTQSTVQRYSLYQVMNIRGKSLLDQWTHLYPWSTIYEWAAKPYNGKVIEDKRKQNKGRPRKLTQRDERNILRALPRLRNSRGHFTSQDDIQEECSLTHIDNHLVYAIVYARTVSIFFAPKRKAYWAWKTTKSPDLIAVKQWNIIWTRCSGPDKFLSICTGR